MEQYRKDLIHLHIIVFIYGFTAILGRLIGLHASDLVWYRVLIAFVSLGALMIYRKVSWQLPRISIIKLIGVGFIVALHWVSFFHAIKIANISVALGCLATTTLFTSFLEPLVLRRRISKLEIFVGVLIIIGLYTIFQFEAHYLAGIVTGLVSAFLAALFTVLNKYFIRDHHPLAISFYEMGGGLLIMSLYVLLKHAEGAPFPLPQGMDYVYLLVLGTICTAYAYMASVKVMQSLSAYTVVLTVNLEPVYGILMAFILFGESEQMSAGFYAGTLMILGAVLLFPVLRRRSFLAH